MSYFKSFFVYVSPFLIYIILVKALFYIFYVTSFYFFVYFSIENVYIYIYIYIFMYMYAYITRNPKMMHNPLNYVTFTLEV